MIIDHIKMQQIIKFICCFLLFYALKIRKLTLPGTKRSATAKYEIFFTGLTIFNRKVTTLLEAINSI